MEISNWGNSGLSDIYVRLHRNNPNTGKREVWQTVTKVWEPFILASIDAYVIDAQEQDATGEYYADLPAELQQADHPITFRWLQKGTPGGPAAEGDVVLPGAEKSTYIAQVSSRYNQIVPPPNATRPETVNVGSFVGNFDQIGARNISLVGPLFSDSSQLWAGFPSNYYLNRFVNVPTSRELVNPPDSTDKAELGPGFVDIDAPIVLKTEPWQIDFDLELQNESLDGANNSDGSWIQFGLYEKFSLLSNDIDNVTTYSVGTSENHWPGAGGSTGPHKSNCTLALVWDKTTDTYAVYECIRVHQGTDIWYTYNKTADFAHVAIARGAVVNFKFIHLPLDKCIEVYVNGVFAHRFNWNSSSDATTGYVGYLNATTHLAFGVCVGKTFQSDYLIRNIQYIGNGFTTKNRGASADAGSPISFSLEETR